MNDDDIVDRLRRAARADARPDLADVEARSRRIHTRRRTIAGVAAAVLVAGAGGIGFGIGQAIGEDDREQLTAAGAAPEPVAPTTTVPPAAVDGAPEAAAVPTTVAAPATTIAVEDMTGADEEASSRSGYAVPEYTHLVDRTTDGGIRVRASRSAPYVHGELVDDGSGWRPAPWCNPSADVRVGVAAPGLIDVTGAPWYDELGPGRDVVVSSAPLGWMDEQHVLVLVVQTAPHVVEVAAALDGATDRTAVVDGVAVLALELATADAVDLPPVDVTVEVTSSDGATRTLAPDELSPYQSRTWQEACAPPPPALPPPGEQPADPAAAEAEIRERFQVLRDRSIAREDKPADLLDDRTGVDEAIDQVDTGQYADAVASAVNTIDELVFTSPTEAWFRYTIDTSYGVFGGRYGTVHLIDGSWRFARAVVCQDLALAGVSCDPPVDQILPPSARMEERCVETPDGTTCESVAPATVVIDD